MDRDVTRDLVYAAAMMLRSGNAYLVVSGAVTAGLMLVPLVAALEEILPEVGQVLIMTVDPGFGHQQFLSSTLPKVRRVRELIEKGKQAESRR